MTTKGDSSDLNELRPSGWLEREVSVILRSRGRFGADSNEFPFRTLLVAFLLGAMAYGAALGSFGYRPLQMFYSALKVPILLIVATLIGLPNFFVLNAVLGLRDDFVAALKAVLAAQATFALALASLAPLTLVYYQSTLDYRHALNFNGLPFLAALLAGQTTLARHYRPLIAKNPQHRVTLRCWLILYAVVAMQMSWVLRPFVGDPHLPSEFMRPNAWSNAFIEIWADLRKIFIG